MNRQPKWTESDSLNFLQAGKYFVPDRETLLATMTKVIPEPSGPAAIADICCGEGLLSLSLLTASERFTVHGLDASAVMMREAKTQLRRFESRFVVHEFDILHRTWPDFGSPLHAVVSSLAIHHLPGVEKRVLFREVFNLLKPAGAFVVCDLVLPTTKEAVAVAADAWDTAVRTRSLAKDGNEDAFVRFQDLQWNFFRYPEDDIDHPSPAYRQLAWLEEVGFVDVDLHWMSAGHAIFSGRRP